MAKTCVGCAYYRPLSENSPNLQHYCNYLLDTGEPRRCPAENCKKKLTLEEAMKKLTQEDKQEIIRLRMEQNVPVKLIAEKLHVSKSAVFNIVSEWKKHGESAISNDEKEPDTVAPVTDSEQEDLVDVPADIIPETEENVKPESEKNDEPLIPQSVIEACWGRIDDLRNQIAQEQAVIDDWERQIAEIKDFFELARIANPLGGTV